MSRKITNEHVENLYSVFKHYCDTNQKNFKELKQKEIVDTIIKQVSLEWNLVSLKGYIVNLIYMFNGETFKWTINEYAQNYFIENICKDFGSVICENAKNALLGHKKYYHDVTRKKEENVDKIEKELISDRKITTLNQIFYGPPGTGKTYTTIDRALNIIDGEVPEKRADAKARFEELSRAGQIEFVTFHQSYGYEEFVEGIKAKTVDGKVSYDVEDGVFKKLAEKAKDIKTSVNNDDFKNNIEKYRKLLKNEDITLETSTGTPFKLHVSPYGISTQTDHSFSINKLIEINNGILSSNPDGTYGKFIVDDINRKFPNIDNIEQNNKNYILIIDEINRGNISKIFGELITLIEPSKRIGASEEIRLRLPYSNELFGVPSNLYIIGTMNTADRSIALMDTALRRRFEFVEMMPKPELLGFEIDGVNIREILETINARVEYLYDKDHCIGHAYFMELDKNSTLSDLNGVFKNKIIPLLQEYFYDDWEKMRLVLNDGFIEKKELKADAIFDNIDDEYIEDEKFLYSIKDSFDRESYLKLCQNR